MMNRVTRRTELIPNNGRKSFYHKAVVIERENGDCELQSYNTIVCSVHNGNFERLWDGYSATTMRHVNSFLDYCGIPGGWKAWWDKQKVGA